MKKLFQEPEMTIQNLAVEDIIMTSGGIVPGENELPGAGL